MRPSVKASVIVPRSVVSAQIIIDGEMVDDLLLKMWISSLPPLPPRNGAFVCKQQSVRAPTNQLFYCVCCDFLSHLQLGISLVSENSSCEVSFGTYSSANYFEFSLDYC